MSKTLVEWLSECPGVSEIQPVHVKLGVGTKATEDFAGAFYVQRGEKRLICLGASPRKPIKSCWSINDQDWYLACHSPDNLDHLTEEQKQYHPCGPTFILMAWTAPEPIDLYESKPYKRFSMEITNDPH